MKTDRTRWTDAVYDVDYQVRRCPWDEFAPKYGITVEEPEAWTVVSDDVNEIVFWFPSQARAGKNNWPNVVAHEAVHGACSVLWHRGVKLTHASEEALCYYVGYLVREITRRLT